MIHTYEQELNVCGMCVMYQLRASCVTTNHFCSLKIEVMFFALSFPNLMLYVCCYSFYDLMYSLLLNTVSVKLVLALMKTWRKHPIEPFHIKHVIQTLCP